MSVRIRAASRAAVCIFSVTYASATAVAAQDVTTTRLAANLWRIDGAVDVIVVQTGADGLLMVDTGYPSAEAGVRAAMERIAGKSEPDVIIDTHWHHAFSNHLYGRRAEIIAHESVPRRMGVTQLMAGALIEPMPAAGIPNHTISDSLAFHFNGDDISVIHVAGAHTDGDVVVFFHDANVVLTGDVVVPHMPWTDIDSGGDPARLLPAVDRLLDLIPRDATVVPGHDRTSDYEDVVAYREMLRSATDTIRTRIAAGATLRGIQALGLPGLARWRGPVPEALFIETLYRWLVTDAGGPAGSKSVRSGLPQITGATDSPTETSPFGAVPAPTLELRNGRWLDDGRFVPKTVYAVNGLLTESRPPEVDRTLDLKGGFVVPAFGEAHTHRLAADLEADAADFVRAGVFYAMVQDPMIAVTERHRRFSARPETPDIIYTQGIVTPSYGVIPAFYRGLAVSGQFGEGVTFGDLEGDVLFTIDSVEELEEKWPALRARNDRFIKVIVAFSDEIARRKYDTVTYAANPPYYSGRPGVRPEVLERLVTLAHGAGLQVSAHIETAADFRLAVSAGVDFVAHLPASWQIGEGTGYGANEREPWLLTEEDAVAARLAGAAVITTATPLVPDDPRLDLLRSVHHDNLRTLRDAGVELLVGSDQSTGTSVDEALFLASLGVLSHADVLLLLAVQTPRTLFPGRKIGHLREGWEATFLVLGGDPLADITNIRDIRHRVKRGHVLDENRRELPDDGVP